MNITVKYFGVLAELTQCMEETIVFTKSTVIELLEVVYQKHPTLNDKNFKVALNNELVDMETIVSEVEVALLPPFSGG
ncbi:MoaD/ThiS family protein [uncultured Maribacter sp.]|uniref:MoaD/ThiS family protein n=1 Tax=uncultured Maribacter sp. TaxID=431308 RepID=UPI0026337426|nr:MoaD/ThiS family protein [uncultured Maribacter sp.]